MHHNKLVYEGRVTLRLHDNLLERNRSNDVIEFHEGEVLMDADALLHPIGKSLLHFLKERPL